MTVEAKTAIGSSVMSVGGAAEEASAALSMAMMFYKSAVVDGAVCRKQQVSSPWRPGVHECRRL